MDNTSTQILINRLQKGDEEAFKIIYERYWERLYQICFYYSRSREDSEDILITVFMSLWNNRDSVIIDKLDSYLVKAVKNQSFKYILKQQQRKKQAYLLEQKVKTCTDENDSPEKVLELKELELQIEDRVAALPEKTKNIFLLSREKGLTYIEIARFLGISVKTVEYHISKAINVLGKYIIILVTFLFFSKF